MAIDADDRSNLAEESAVHAESYEMEAPPTPLDLPALQAREEELTVARGFQLRHPGEVSALSVCSSGGSSATESFTTGSSTIGKKGLSGRPLVPPTETQWLDGCGRRPQARGSRSTDNFSPAFA